MKKIIFLAALVSLVGVASQAFAVEWLTDLPKAQAQAKLEKKKVLIDFTGSDWCPPCKLVHDQVLSTPEFEKYAATNFVLVVIDFPIKAKQTEELAKANTDLAKKMNVDGFPTILVLDETGKELSRETGYGGETPKEYIKKLNTRLGEKSFLGK